MISISVEEICTATNGVLKSDYQSLVDCDSVIINNVSTDTRTIKSGDLFIALKGPSFDAHKLLPNAIEKGVSVLLVEKSSDIFVDKKSIVIEVDDTRIALGLLSSFVKMKKVKKNNAGLKCAAITGSNGKTTCKELLSSILASHCGSADKVLATAGNFNNDIGLPLTLLRIEEQHEYAVVELGANHIGEIAYTSALAKPDVALVNNVMPAHLEGFGSLEGIANAKSEIWSSLTDSGTAIVNLDANFAEKFVQLLTDKKQPFLSFSTHSQETTDATADVFTTGITFNDVGQASFTLNAKASVFSVQDISSQIKDEPSDKTSNQSIQLKLNLPGKHNVSNALAASSMALALGCSLDDIKQGLDNVKPVAGRVNVELLNPTLTVIDDTYNANSASVKAGIDLLAQHQAQRVLICGDMGELGAYAEAEHQAIGEYAQQHHIDRLFTVGRLSQLATNAYNAASQNTCAVHFSDKESLKLAVEDFLSNEASKVVVLVKGSRSAKMEEIVAFIKQKHGA